MNSNSNRYPRSIIFSCVSIFLIGSMIACHSGGSGKDAGLTQAQKDSIAREEIRKNTVKATDLTAAYAQNEANADTRYKGKKIYVSGKVSLIGKDILGNAYVNLEGHEILHFVKCSTSDTTALAKLSEGTAITVKGTCEGSMIAVIMSDCEILPSK